MDENTKKLLQGVSLADLKTARPDLVETIGSEALAENTKQNKSGHPAEKQTVVIPGQETVVKSESETKLEAELAAMKKKEKVNLIQGKRTKVVALFTPGVVSLVETYLPTAEALADKIPAGVDDKTFESLVDTMLNSEKAGVIEKIQALKIPGLDTTKLETAPGNVKVEKSGEKPKSSTLGHCLP